MWQRRRRSGGGWELSEITSKHIAYHYSWHRISTLSLLQIGRKCEGRGEREYMFGQGSKRPYQQQQFPWDSVRNVEFQPPPRLAVSLCILKRFWWSVCTFEKHYSSQWMTYGGQNCHFSVIPPWQVPLIKYGTPSLSGLPALQAASTSWWALLCKTKPIAERTFCMDVVPCLS